MFSFQLNDLYTAMPRLTQANLLGMAPGQALPTASAMRPATLNVIHEASHAGEFFYSLGRGTVDARLVTRVLLHHSMASERTISFEELVSDFLLFHHAVATSPVIWRNLVAYVVGQSNDKATKPDSMGRMPAEAIRDRLGEEIRSAQIESKHFDLFVAVEGDFVISMLAQVNLVVPGTALTYRVSRVIPIPNYEIYEDVLRAGSLVKLLEALSTADLGLVKSQIQKKVAVSPSFIANELASAAIRASDRARGTRNAAHSVAALFYALGTVWDPSTPAELVATESVQSAPGFAALLNNVSMLAAYQRRVATHGAFERGQYDDHVLSREIIPLFVEAVERISPYAERTLAQAVGHIGTASVSEFDATKSHVALYESWNFSRSVSAFVPVRNTRTGFGRFLIEDTAVSEALSTSLAPIADTFSVEGFVERHLAALSAAVPGAYDVRTDGTRMLLALPSLTALPAPLGVTSETLLAALQSSEDFAPDMTAISKHRVSDSEGMGSDTLRAAVRRGESIVHSYYVTILAVAIARGGILSIGSVPASEDAMGGANVAVYWETSTDSRVPFGPTGLLGGRVETAEPLERLAYAPDVAPTLTITPPALPLRDHERSLHVWNWYEESTPIEYNDSFKATIANQELVVKLDEVDVLSLGYRRDRLRFLLPASARSIADMWVTWYNSTNNELIALNEKTTDTAAKAAIEGRQLQAGVLLVQRLRAVGRSPVGKTIARLINARLASQLRGKGQIDAMKGLYVVPHQIRLEVWAGLVQLQLLGVLSSESADTIQQAMVSTNALATVMTMGLDEK